MKGVEGAMETGARTPAAARANCMKEVLRLGGETPATGAPEASARKSATGSAKTLKWRGSRRLRGGGE
jgi:hypothetical protein